MNWINIKTSDLRSREFIGSDPIARGTWVAVLGYCYEQENAGIIKGCKAWKDRQWQQVCGVTREEIDGAKSLMNWQDDDLQIWGYPSDLEKEIKAKREAGRKGGQARTQAKIEAAKANGAKHNPSTTQAEPKQTPNVIVIERERVIEKEDGSGVVTPPPALSSDQTEKPQKQPKQTDAEWLAELATSPAYRGIDVRREHAKALVWASAAKKTMSRRRFINWVNRCETAMAPQTARAFDSRPSVAEPNGWRAWVNENAPESVYARGGAQEGAQWSALDRATQDWLTKQTAKAEQFQHRK
jgi:hypothetical protein